VADKCTYSNCNLDVHTGDKCILHCEKNNFSEKETIDFWHKITDKISRNETYFEGIIFAERSSYSSFSYSTDEKIKFQSKFEFSGCVFNDEIAFSSLHFAEEVSFFGCQFLKGLIFSDCIFSQKLLFFSSDFSDSFSIDTVEFHEYVDITYANDFTDLEIDISSTFFNNDFVIYCEPPYPYKEEKGITKIAISNSYIADKTIVSFEFDGSPMESLKIADIDNFGILKLSNMIITKEVVVKKSNLGKTSFLNIDFDAQDIILSANNLIDTIWSNVKWGRKNKIKANRDEFRQLKFAYDKQANYIEANEFYALEMRAMQKELKKTNGHIQDKITFWLGWFASNHSQYWILPFIWMILFSFGFYGLAVYAAGLEQSWNCYFSFANPFSTKYDGDGLGWWILNKAFFAFFAYHLIVSLRRNTKR